MSSKKRRGIPVILSSEIQIRNPYILAIPGERTYYLYGTTDQHAWEGKGTGFDMYESQDLEVWSGPFPVFRPDHQFWAPDVHAYQNT